MNKNEVVHRIYTRIAGVDWVDIYKSEIGIYFGHYGAEYIVSVDADNLFVEEVKGHMLVSSDRAKTIQKHLTR